MNGLTVCGIILAVIVAILAALPLTLPPLVELDNYVVMCPLPGPSFTPWPDPNYRLARGSYYEGASENYYLYVHSYCLQGKAQGLEHHVLASSDAWDKIDFKSDVVVRGELHDPDPWKVLGIGYTAAVGTKLVKEPWTSHSFINGVKSKRVARATPLLASMANGRFPFAQSKSLDPAAFTVNFETPTYELDELSFGAPPARSRLRACALPPPLRLLATAPADLPLITENGIDRKKCKGYWVERVSFSSLRVNLLEWAWFGVQRAVGCAWASPCFRSRGETVP